MSKLVRPPDPGMNVIFVHSYLDEAGLTQCEYRVYGHLARRAGNGYAFPGLRSMAEICRADIKSISKAIAGLEARRMIVRKRNPGHSTEYHLTPASQWLGVGSNGTLAQKGVGNDTTPGVGPNGGGGVGNYPTEGYPCKVIHSKEIHTPVVPKGDVNAALKQDQDVESLYSLYPRKIGKGSALKAIRKALKSTDAEVLREAVGAYAAAVGSWPKEERQFVPHPATWFNSRRWEDDRTEWDRKPKPATKNGLPSPHIPLIRFA